MTFRLSANNNISNSQPYITLNDFSILSKCYKHGRILRRSKFNSEYINACSKYSTSESEIEFCRNEQTVGPYLVDRDRRNIIR